MASTDNNEEGEHRPLLHSHSSQESRPSTSANGISRAVEDDVIPETAVVGRNLNWTSAYMIVLSRVVGSGIFATPGAIVKSAGSIGLTLSLWIAGALIAACSLAVYLEYGCMLPRSGGLKVYLEYTYRRPKFLATTLFAVWAIFLGFTASNCVIFGEYVLFALGQQPSEWKQKLLAIGLLTAVVVVHGCFLKVGIVVQNILGWLKVGLITFMIMTGLAVVLIRPQQSSSNSLSWEAIWADSNWHWGMMATAFFKVIYSYAGLDNINNVLNEVKDPVKTVKTVGPMALLTACALYLLVNIAFFLVVPIEEIKESGELIAALFFEKTFGSHVGKTLLPFTIAISAAGNVMVVSFAYVSLHHECEFLPLSPSAELWTGSTKPRDSEARIFALLSVPLIVQTVQCSARWLRGTLHTVFPYHTAPASERCVQLHSRRGKLSWAILPCRYIIWNHLASNQKARCRASIQGVVVCSVLPSDHRMRFACRSVLPTKGWSWRRWVFLRHICHSRDWNVSSILPEQSQIELIHLACCLELYIGSFGRGSYHEYVEASWKRRSTF